MTVVLDNLAGGVSRDEIYENWPSLPPEAIEAAVGYAADLARDRIVQIPQ